jgi:pyrimidine-specific ribonucleoside hydrolase
METGDPDDLLTLILLAGHPRADLRAVTITPGTPHQVGVVRHVLDRLGLDLPVGAFDLDHTKDGREVTCVSAWHFKVLGDVPPSRDAAAGWEVLAEALDPATTLVTGGPLKNLGALLRRQPEGTPIRWVAQGGFCGTPVVPDDQQLPKFRSKRRVPTYNLNGDPGSALLALDAPRTVGRRFVGKNVCHGVVYDAAMHARVRDTLATLPDGLHRDATALLYRCMSRYLDKKPRGKALHDPLAAACALDPTIGSWADVHLSRSGGRWGADWPDEDHPHNATCLVSLDEAAFQRVFLGG